MLTSGLFYPIFMFHRLVFIVNVFLLPPFGQVLGMIFFTLLFLLYLVHFHPFKAKLDRSLLIFSHALLLFVYLLVLYLHFD